MKYTIKYSIGGAKRPNLWKQSKKEKQSIDKTDTSFEIAKTKVKDLVEKAKTKNSAKSNSYKIYDTWEGNMRSIESSCTCLFPL